jgi:thiol-disulfide isomerase/thioredoxin
VLTSKSVFEKAVESAPCAVVFFTSATCPPCRIVYPHFERLASEIGERAAFIKVDVGIGREIGSIYNISATPTFITWSRGEKLDEWQGASPDDLKQNVDMLLRVTYPRECPSSSSIELK